MTTDFKTLRYELQCQWVGPMPIESFLQQFLEIDQSKLEGKPKLPEDYFDSITRPVTPSEIHLSFVKLVRDSGIMPNLHLFPCLDNETDLERMPNLDIAAYDSDFKGHSNQPISYEHCELLFKLGSQNVDSNIFEDLSKEGTAADLEKFLSQLNKVPNDCRAQLTYYARPWMSCQHRTHCFMVWIGDPWARIIRFDCSGAIVTERFDIRSEGHLLGEFLWRLSWASPAMRGKDTTVSKVTDEAAIKLAQDKLSQWAPVPQSSEAVLELQIPDQGSDGKWRKVLIWGPLANPQCVVGRATRGYPAWDLKDKKVVFVKDSWRAVVQHLSKETDILRTLNDAEVCNVPKLLYGDDVPGQMTITQDFANANWNRGAQPGTFSKRAHIRFASDLIGTRITKFECSKEFVQAWFDAFLAHQEAYEKCGILHRDISVDNILIKPGGGGFLNDWDLARTLSDTDTGPRQPSHFGTWQFMSINTLGTPDKKHTLQDDLESFFWVLLYVTIRYLSTSIIQTGTSIAMIMHNIFDSSITNGTEITGGMVKEQVVRHRRPIGPKFSVENNVPLSVLIEEILRIIKAYLNYWTNFSEEVDRLAEEKNIAPESAEELYKSKEKDLKLYSHVAMVAFGRTALGKNWPTNDRSSDHCGRPSKRPAADDAPNDAQASESNRETKRVKNAEE